ncbi:MAG: hypothetical protein RIS84_2004 [Pseudomonadota bacterium]|jgi:hypothetical protein
MKNLSDYPINELKLIYTLLHAQLSSNSALMDSQLLQDLQHHLLKQAVQEGIDVTTHTLWASWLHRKA